LIVGDQNKLSVIKTPSNFEFKFTNEAIVTRIAGKQNEINGLIA
jgi:hypothetical protein